MRQLLLHIVVGTCLVLSGASCSPTNRDPDLLGAGSTLAYPLLSKWSAEYLAASGIAIQYESIGSGAGIQKLIHKQIDFCCTDGPMNLNQLEEARTSGGEVLYLPLLGTAVVPVYNLSGIKGQIKFSGSVLADIYLGKIKKWNDAALTKLNPEVSLPNEDILVIHRGDGSGTTYLWTDYLAKVSSEWKEKVGVGTSVAFPVGIAAKGGEGLPGVVRSTPASIGYVEFIYALQNDLKYGLVENREGDFINADLESVTAAADASVAALPDSLCGSITNAAGKKSYPISGMAWAVTFANCPGGKGKRVRDFLYWATHEGQEFVEPLHYARLPKGLVERLEAKLDAIK